jgi:hypothetical protein
MGIHINIHAFFLVRWKALNGLREILHHKVKSGSIKLLQDLNFLFYSPRISATNIGQLRAQLLMEK